MKSTVELEVALRGLRARAPFRQVGHDAKLERWVEEASARNYWRSLCERDQPRYVGRAPEPCDQAEAVNAA